MQYRNIPLAVLACLACAPAAHAQIIASDSFDIPSYTPGSLAGQAVGGTGFAGNWALIPGLGQDLSVVSPGFVGRPTVTAGNSGDFANFSSRFTVTSGQLYLSYDITNPNPTNLNSSRIDLRTSLNTASTLFGAAGALADFNLETRGGFGSTAVAQTNIASTGAHHLVGVLDFTNHQIAIFVDPTATSFYDSSGANDADGVAAWTPPAAAYTATGYSLVNNLSDQATFDNVVFALDAPSVGVRATAVPEPGSIALLIGMGVTGAAFLRRRKQHQKAA